MKLTKAAIAVAFVGLLAACGGVDREGTRDQLIESLEAAGVSADAGCIDDALDQYSDDELTTIDEALQDGNQSGAAGELLSELLACVPTP